MIKRNIEENRRKATQRTFCSMSSARPLSNGSAIMVILFFLLGVSAKHLRDDVSTTVSQSATEGSATFSHERRSARKIVLYRCEKIRDATVYLNIDLSIHATQIVHDAIQVELAGAVNDVLP
jgi:hypothetical protein